MPRLVRVPGMCLVAALAVLPAPARPAAAAVAPAGAFAARGRLTEAQKLASQRADAYRIKRETIWIGARNHFHETRERAEMLRRARRGDRAAIRGLHVRRAGGDEGPIVEDAQPTGPGVVPPTLARPAAVRGALVVPTNARCNDPAGDSPSTTQSEESVAALGDGVVVAWNDGQGFNTFPYGDVQGFGWSADGGVTWTDGGSPPHPAAYPSFRWSSDPVMTVNEKTGDFWYCGMAVTDAANNAIAVARGRFTAGVFAFDSVFVVRRVPNSTLLLDKQWVACDSLTGNLYVTNTTYGVTTNLIDFYRSTDGGRTWSAPLAMSAVADSGNVQGSRVAVAGNGDVEVAWYAAQVTDADALRFRLSTDGGASFGPEVTPTTFFQQFGTGAPGFNRNRGVNFPSIAVDRTTGPHRGRTYMAWQESHHFLSVALPPAGATTVTETEPNNSSGTAAAFTVGQTLQGALTTTNNATDLDYWSVVLAAGQGIVVSAGTSPPTSAWSLRLLAPDGNQRLCYGGNGDSTVAGSAYYSFTAPVTGTYFLRVAANSWRPASYTVYTAPVVHGSERGRDQRDGFVTWSDNGTAWSTPVRIDDDMVGYDLYLPELAVGPDGCVYASWFDHRDDTYGTRAHVYMSRSVDGGATWAANVPVTSAPSNFTTSLTNIIPNMGDYLNLTASATRVHPVWADGRNTSSVDVWTTAVDATSGITACPGDTTMVAPGTASRGWQVTNANPLFGGAYGVTLTNARNWPSTAAASVALGAATTALYAADVSVPDTAAEGPVTFCLTLKTPGGVVVGQCCQTITVLNPQLGVAPGVNVLSLARSRPNPAFGSATITFMLPRPGRARLTVYDLSGARVTTLIDGERPAGTNVAVWNGRDSRESPVGAGAYFYRLEFEGRTLTRRLVLMR